MVMATHRPKHAAAGIPEDFPYHMGSGIKTVRIRQGITIEEMTKRLGVHNTIVYRQERKPWASAGSVAAYAKAMGVTVIDIMDAARRDG